MVNTHDRTSVLLLLFGGVMLLLYGVRLTSSSLTFRRNSPSVNGRGDVRLCLLKVWRNL
ncbi:hypothetical protein [Scytonema sp. HK-05]|uniref:hypothetical protein n=1 Tax=Scytonema sp. HK-05 TaxID=1137095 RepID=UPI000A6E6F14|nr:hypothetical protein [Scytonema sp. HK-05]